MSTIPGGEQYQEMAAFWRLRLPGMAPPDRGPQMPVQVASQACALIGALPENAEIKHVTEYARDLLRKTLRGKGGGKPWAAPGHRT